MKAWPIRRRFSCGSQTPASADRKRLSASTTCRSVWKWLVNSAITDSCSALRSRPLFTRMHDNCAADRLVQQGRGHRRIDAAGQPADHAVGPHALARVCSIVCAGEIAQVPGALAATDHGHEIVQDRAAAQRVRDLGMELQAVHGQAVVLDRGDRAGRVWASGTKSSETRVTWSPWLIHTSVSAGRPANRSACESIVAACPAVLAGRCAVDLAAQDLAQQLHAVADAQHGNAQVEHFGVAPRGARFIHAGRPARQDDAARLMGPDAVRRDIVPDDLAEDVLLAHPPGDQLGVLRTEVQHQDAFVEQIRGWRRSVECGHGDA